MSNRKFPNDFIWGTATSSYQIEGNNSNTDWWAWEHRNRNKDTFSPFIKKSKYPLEPSLNACDSYNRFEEDFDLCVEMNNNAVRMGIEWARIEPEEGRFDQNEIEHYKKVFKSAKERGLKTYVTLFHFTSPIWLAKKGGWVNPKTPGLFARYVRFCAENFGDLIDVYLTINEPQVYASVSYLVGRWPPQKNNPLLALIVHINMIRAHNIAYRKIKETKSSFTVGVVKNIVRHSPSPKSKNPLDNIYCLFMNFMSSDFYILFVKRNLDLLGINYYFGNLVKNLKKVNPNDKVSDMGWWLDPSGLKKVLLHSRKYNLPVYITEHGLADEKDTHREWYLKESLKICLEAIDEGVDLRGYFHWSLIDNYEWAEGFWPRFGLVAIDRENGLKRIPRKSFYTYSDICKNGSIDK